MTWSLDAVSDIISAQGQQRRVREEEEERQICAQLHRAVAEVPLQTTDLLLQLWRQNMDRSGHYMNRRRTRAAYRLMAYHCRREIIRRTLP